MYDSGVFPFLDCEGEEEGGVGCGVCRSICL